MSDDFEFEPVRGLPAMLPAGEHILWQGAPDWRATALRIFHVRKVAIYFLLLFAWRFTLAAERGADLSTTLIDNVPMFGLAVLALGLLTGLAWLTSRTTVYTVTNKRVVMRVGIALPITWNLPYTALETASLKTYGDGTGNIALVLSGDQRLAYLVMWPHVRPWYLRKPQPMLRLVPVATKVAALIAEAAAPLRAAVAAPAVKQAANQTQPVPSGVMPAGTVAA